MKNEKLLPILLLLCVGVFTTSISNAEPLNTAFTYQGRLIDGNDTADGPHDFVFRVFNSPTDGNQVDGDVFKADVDVIDGYFTVVLDFGGLVFAGQKRWLEIGVRPGEMEDPNGYATLFPRQEITTTPYSIYALAAGNAEALGGLDPGEFALTSHNHSAAHITSGTLSTSRYSAIDDLAAEGFLGNDKGDIAMNNEILQPLLNADMVDGKHASSFMETAADFGRSGVAANLYEGTTPLSSKYLGIGAMAANSDMLDGYHASAFLSSGLDYGRSGVSSTLYEGTSTLASKYVDVTGDSMTASLEVTSSPSAFAVKGIGDFAPTNGYLGVQGTDDFDGITSLDISGREIGVLGLSTGTSTTDNYGLFGHSNGVGVRGEYAPDPNNYGELGRSGYGVYGKGTSYGLYGVGESRGVYGYTNGDSGYGVYGYSLGATGRGVYGYASSSAAGENYGGYFIAAGEGGRGVYGYASKSGDFTTYGGYFQSNATYGAAVYAKHGSSDVYARLASSGTAITGYHSSASYGWVGTQNYALYGQNGNSNGYGCYAYSYGSGGTGVYARGGASDGIGIYAKGGSTGYAADFQGKVRIRGWSSGATIMELGEGLDYAEGFNVSRTNVIEAGYVLVIDSENPGNLMMSNKAYDTRVAGIAAGANGLGSGIRLGAGQFDIDVALAGRVYCCVDATEAGIEAGDLLTTSSVPGYAMKALNYRRAQGAILGKAMESMPKGQKGQILVLVTLQ